MKKNIKTYQIIFAFIIGMVPALAFAAPGIPHQFYGNATYTNGTNIAGGNVNVKIGSTQVASVPISNGRYGYVPNLLLITDPDNNKVGSTLSFFIGGIDTGKTAIFANGGYTKLDLSISPPSSGGGSVGGGGGTVPPTTTNPGDTNGDNVANEYDLSIMMADWGKTGTSVADLNHDSVVDEYDFALLMYNWSV